MTDEHLAKPPCCSRHSTWDVLGEAVWELVAEDGDFRTTRLVVPGGWIYQTARGGEVTQMFISDEPVRAAARSWSRSMRLVRDLREQEGR